MSSNEIKSDLGREALESVPGAWRTIYVAVFIVLCVAFGTLAAVEHDDRGRWAAAPFTTLTQVVIGTGTASGLLSLFITEIGRAIMLPSVWLEKKLNENLQRSRERRRRERDQHRQAMERLNREAFEKALSDAREQIKAEVLTEMRKEVRVEALSEVFAEVLDEIRSEGFNEGRKAGLLEAQGKKSPPHGENGSDSE